MPATPSSLRRPKFATVPIDFGEGDVVVFTFDRNKITDPWMEHWSELEESQDAKLMNEALADLIHAWDIVEGDGSPYEVSAEHIGYLFALPDKIRLLRAFLTADLPSEDEKRGSSERSGTPPTASSEPPLVSPNGSETSTLVPLSTSPSPT